ncbi:MAG: hypothetical protein K9J27_10120 [Bacteroidales bacterium]|nr:hypothetical protein [Bacteroidales bacterium]MCF8334518.1 hypothetical protein [Bacteroidales bacterium]
MKVVGQSVFALTHIFLQPPAANTARETILIDWMVISVIWIDYSTKANNRKTLTEHIEARGFNNEDGEARTLRRTYQQCE